MNEEKTIPSNVEFTDEAKSDFEDLDGSQKIVVIKGIQKVAKNPKPKSEGGYGEPLGNKNDNDLTGLCKVKFVKSGIRVVYRCVFDASHVGMKVIVISMRSDNEVYEEAAKRIK